MQDRHDFPFVSIIIVNLNGRGYLEVLLESLTSLDYPPDKYEIIIVDNGSTDGSEQFLAQNYPGVKLIKNNANKGFAVANNQGAKAARGDYVAFLNNDTKVDKMWLHELVLPIYLEKDIACAGSKVLSMDGKTIDFAGGMINFEGKGFQTDFGKDIASDIHRQYEFVPFVNGGAMLVDRKVFLGAGGFDEDFFAYYEDVDFGWRLWVLGYRVILSPKSIVYHVHHGTSKLFSEDKLRFLKERNALFSVYKNYEDENLAKVFSGTLLNIYNRIFTDVDFDYRKYYDFSIAQAAASTGKNANDTESPDKQGGSGGASVVLDAEPLSSLMAVKSFFDNLSKLKEKRAFIQANRKRDDKAVATYFKGIFLSVSADLQYQRNQVDILKSLGIYDIFEKQIKRNLLIISDEVVSSLMAGPAIRVYNFANVLSEHMHVTLAVPNKTDLEGQPFNITQYKDESSVRQLLEKCDIVLCSGMTFSKFRNIRNSDKYIIIDIYDPYNLATLAEYADEPITRQLEVYKSVQPITNEMLYNGDFFICASERQRDFWLGMLAALNRVNPYSYNQDAAMRKLIDVIPFGLPSNKPVHTENVLKGKVEGINKDDFVIIWGGGIYNWFDPLTLIKAMSIVGKKRDDIKLFFLGVKHPNPQVKELTLAEKTIELSKSLGIFGKNVFFNFGWVEYNKRHNYFIEADAGIITHPDHIETRFAFRTRILDYLWAGLPIISTEGDSLSDMVKLEGLGLTVEAGRPDKLADAILELANNEDFYKKCAKSVQKTSSAFKWENICQPLIGFCADPFSSALRNKLRPGQVSSGVNVLDMYGSGTPSGAAEGNLNAGSRQNKGKSYLIRRFFYHLRTGGVKSAFRVFSNYLKGS